MPGKFSDTHYTAQCAHLGNYNSSTVKDVVEVPGYEVKTAQISDWCQGATRGLKYGNMQKNKLEATCEVN